MNYEDNVHTLMGTATWKAMDQLSFTFGLAYSMAESEMQDVSIASDPHTNGDRLDTLTGWKGTYNMANTNNVESYSKLEYNTIDLDIKALYNIADNIDLTVNYMLTDVDDSEDYVYGDESGMYQSLRTWVTYHF